MYPQHTPSLKVQEEALDILANEPTYDSKSFSKIKEDFNILAAMLHQAIKHLNLDLTAKQYWELLQYLDTLLLWNKTYNLTAITKPTEAIVKHVIDCLAIIPTLNDNEFKLSTNDMLDIGTGAGLPAVIIAICQPNRICTPLDSNQKKIRFIRQVVSELALSNVKPVASRIETFDGSFDLITSRAFASLQDFVDLATPYLSNNGQLLAMKGKAPTQEEVKNLSSDWDINIISLNVPFLSDSRHLIKLSPVDKVTE